MRNVYKRLVHTIKFLFFWTIDSYYVSFRLAVIFLKRGNAEQFIRTSSGNHPTIILIPGIYEPWQFMEPVAKLLSRQGYSVHFVTALGYNFKDIPSMAKEVRDYIKQHQLENVVIVAHSKGGLIAKYVLSYFNQQDIVKHVIALNSPFGGSVYAQFAPVPGMRDFSPKGELVKNLLANKLINSRITSIYAAIDPYIPVSSHLDGAVNYQIDMIGHFRIITNTTVQTKILADLKHHFSSAKS